VDLAVDDFGKAQAFYTALFGWDVPTGPAEAGNYSIALWQGHPVAGIGPKQNPEHQPTVWTTYLAVEDADATAAKITAAGGDLLNGPFDVLDVGRMAIGMDTGGAVFGIWQAMKHTGVDIVNVSNTLVWNEVMGRDFEGAKKFYAEVFGYDYGDASSEDFQYATFKVDGVDAGGIGALPDSVPDDVPAHWMAYFGVDDADATVAKVTELGGSVLRPAWDSPFGRLATVADDQGAPFAIIQMS
jgi:predicted enzyme related to lactoylglutathione lyase